MTQCTSSLLLQVRPTCVRQRTAPTSRRWNVSLLGASSAVLISAPSHTFSLDFKLLIFLLQFDCFTIYFKIKRSRAHSSKIILSMGSVTYTVHTCFKSNREREGFNLTAQEGWASVHFSILLSFSHNLFQPGKRAPPLRQTGQWEEELFLNWRPQRNSPFLILLYAWPPFLPEWGKPLALNSKKKKGSPNPCFKKLKQFNKRYCKGSTTAYGCLLMHKPSMLVNCPSTVTKLSCPKTVI